jgi:hypothetical protein
MIEYFGASYLGRSHHGIQCALKIAVLWDTWGLNINRDQSEF